MSTPLANIAYALRFFNMTDEEDAKLLADTSWNYQNVPQPVRTESRQCKRYGRGEQPTYTEITEHFQDGSSFSRSA